MTTARSRFPTPFLLVALLLSAIGFGVNLYVATAFDERHAYEDWETLFSSDPNWYLRKLIDGTYASKRHPLFHVFVSMPARGLSHVAAAVTGADEATLRRQLLLLAAPLASGMKTALLLGFCVTLGLSLRWSVLIALVDIASLSRLIFGSIPESFGATALAMTWILLLTARTLRNPDAAPSRGWWFACGLFALGVTITNVVPFGILLAIVLRVRLGNWVPALRQAGVMAMLVLLAGAVLHAISLPLVEPEPPRGARVASLQPAVAITSTATPESIRQLRRFVLFAPQIMMKHLAGGTTSTFMAPPAINLPVPADRRARTRLHVDTQAYTREWLACIAFVFVVFIAAVIAIPGVAGARPLFFGIIVVLAFNLALFSLWGTGDSVFLYTLHWQPFLVALLALALMTQARRLRPIVTASVFLFLGAEVLLNARFLSAAWRAL